MSSDAEKPVKEVVGSPFGQRVARQIIEKLFRLQPVWKSSQLVDRCVQMHKESGGFMTSDPSIPIRRVLGELKNEGTVDAPSHGWWRWNTASSEVDSNPQEVELPAIPSIDEGIESIEPAIVPEREIGDGPECVYLYFNPNDRRLAELEGRNAWECKIGRTSEHDPSRRILGQGVSTALSRLPVLGLVLRTIDSPALESALHSSLRLVSAEVPDSLGTEWFITSPARVEAWYVKYQNALGEIEIEKKSGDDRQAG